MQTKVVTIKESKKKEYKVKKRGGNKTNTIKILKKTVELEESHADETCL